MTDSLLIIRLRQGDETSFKKLFERYSSDIYAFSKSVLKDRILAEEVVQEVFLKVWLKRQSFDPDRSFKAFIFTIARNSAYNMLKKALHDRELSEAVFYQSQSFYTPTEDMIQTEDLEQIRLEILAELTPKCRHIFELSRNEGKSHKEIAAELGISERTVKNQITIALGIIRNYFQVNKEVLHLFPILPILF